MMSITSHIQAILQDPAFPEIFQQLKENIEREKALRKEYYALIHENIKAEFINGEIVYNSPVKQGHWNVASNLLATLLPYVKSKKLGKVGVEKAMIELTRNNYEPDICFFSKEKAQDFTIDQMLLPAPDFIAEIISKSTEKIDRGIKFIDYAHHGVQEYWLIDPEKETLEQYINQEGQFQLLTKHKTKGEVYSEAIEGYVLALGELWE